MNTAEKRKEMDELKSEYDELKKQLEIETKERKKIEEAYVELVQMKNQLIASMNGEGDALGLMIKYIKKYKKYLKKKIWFLWFCDHKELIQKYCLFPVHFCKTLILISFFVK